MRLFNISLISFSLLLCLQVYGQEPSGLLLYDAPSLKAMKEEFLQNNKAGTALKKIKQADSAMLKGPFSVTFEKTKLAPSGDIHDYLSQAPYWWADPSKKNGEPYIRKDGQRNPEIYRLHDRFQLGNLSVVVEDLSMGYFISGDEKYAKRANELLKIFFIDPATAMNPNLKYAQYIPGLNDGRGIGIIETRGLIDIPESIALLAGSKSLKEETIAGVKKWFSDYLFWLRESPNGKSEVKEKNNHGTNYDLQVIDFALFTGNKDLAKDILTAITIPRLEVQIDPDGRQPLETARTNSWDYVNMNLDAWFKLARLSEHLGIDLWRQVNSKASGIKTAVAWLIPYASGEKKWPYQQLNAFGKGEVNSIMQRARVKYPDLDYSKL